MGDVWHYHVKCPINMQMYRDTNDCGKMLLWWKYAFCYGYMGQTFVYEISWWQAAGSPVGDGGETHAPAA